MRESSSKGMNGKLQATILKKCSLESHRPESNKGCANGTCQHTCEASSIEKCPHKWCGSSRACGLNRSAVQEQQNAG